MHYLSGLIGLVFVVVALLSWQTPWIAGFFLVCGVLAFLAIRPSRVVWWLYACCIASATAAATLFGRFFLLVEPLTVEDETSRFDYELLLIFVAGIAMMYIVTEYCCWLKGRQDRVKLKIPLRRWRDLFRRFEVSRSQ